MTQPQTQALLGSTLELAQRSVEIVSVATEGLGQLARTAPESVVALDPRPLLVGELHGRSLPRRRTQIPPSTRGCSGGASQDEPAALAAPAPPIDPLPNRIIDALIEGPLRTTDLAERLRVSEAIILRRLRQLAGPRAEPVSSCDDADGGSRVAFSTAETTAQAFVSIAMLVRRSARGSAESLAVTRGPRSTHSITGEDANGAPPSRCTRHARAGGHARASV